MPRKKAVAAPEVTAIPTPPAPPPPPPPAVLELQADIVRLIRGRDVLKEESRKARAGLIQAQAMCQIADGNLSEVEQEIQYIHSQIAQLSGAIPQLNYGPAPMIGSAADMVNRGFVPNPQAAGIGSVPTPQLTGNSDMVNRGHASRALAGELV